MPTEIEHTAVCSVCGKREPAVLYGDYFTYYRCPGNWLVVGVSNDYIHVCSWQCVMNVAQRNTEPAAERDSAGSRTLGP